MEAELARLLGATDALWQPVRALRQQRFAAVLVERRELFRRAGLQMPHGGGADAAERQRRSRAAREMERTGMVTFGGRRGQRTHWRLTDRGDWRLRASCGTGEYEPMMMAIDTLRRLEKVRHDAEDNMVPEYWIAGMPDDPGGRGRMSALELLLLPALCRGLVTAWCDLNGVVAYQTNTAISASPPPSDLSEFDQELSDAYDVGFAAAEQDLAIARPSNANLCVIALSAGCWPPIPKSATKIAAELRRWLES